MPKFLKTSGRIIIIMFGKPSIMKSLLALLLFLVSFCVAEDVFSGGMRPYLVKKEHRKSLIVTRYGEVSVIDIPTGSSRGDHYHLEFITLEPNSLFLPVLLHADMVFYVHTGSGKLSWAEDGKDMKRMHIKKGDVYRLHPGSVFFMQSNLETERHKLRVYAIFANTDEGIYDPSIGAYSSINDLVLGFDNKLLQSAFKVSDEVIEEMTSAMKPPAIVHAVPEKKSRFWEIEARLLHAFTSNKDDIFYGINNGGKKKTKTFNILDADPDFQNCNGWSVTVGRRDLKSLRGSNVGVFMVNLTKGSMMGPHWNPMANEIAIVLQGQGMVRVVCSSNTNENETECKNMRFRVEEGDVFAVPRFHPMAQMSFNNGSLVLMGFSTSTRKNYPQFLVGKRSVLQTLNKEILALSFNVTNDTVDDLLTPQNEAIILDCTSCAEEEETKMKEEKEKEKQEEEAREREEERKREEEAAKKREEEEEREKEEEEAREREEERKRQEEAAKKKEEEEREREEEEAREREEERKREREEKREQEKRKREEEEEREKKEREEERKQEEEEWERREREREAAEKRQGEEWRRREAARREQEQARKEEEKRQKRRRQQEKEARKKREREEEQRKKEEQEREGEGEKGRRVPRKFWKV